MFIKRSNRIFMAAIFLLLGWFYTPANCEEFLFCTPNTEDQRIFKVSNDILEEAFNRLGHSFKLISNPAKRCPLEINGGRIDGDSHRIFNFNANNEYPNLIRVEEVIQSIDQSVFTKNLKIKPDGWESIKQYKIIHLFGIKIIESGLSKANVPSENIIPVFSHEQAFNQLALDRADLIIVNSSTGNSYLKKMALIDSGIKLLKPPLVMFDLYPYMHKKHKNIAKKLALLINEMKKEGTYHKIISGHPY